MQYKTYGSMSFNQGNLCLIPCKLRIDTVFNMKYILP